MNLYLLRHAIAVERETPGVEDDSKRELTPKGAAKMRRVARGMLALELKFNLILSSPYLRTRQTADIVADEFNARSILRFTDSLIPGAAGEQVIAEITKHHLKRENILLVGHEPLLSSLIATLISGDSTLDISMKKGGLCCLTTSALSYGRCAVLEWLMYPSQLAELEKG
jgi:phosphohistidine phosphatase